MSGAKIYYNSALLRKTQNSKVTIAPNYYIKLLLGLGFVPITTSFVNFSNMRRGIGIFSCKHFLLKTVLTVLIVKLS